MKKIINRTLLLVLLLVPLIYMLQENKKIKAMELAEFDTDESVLKLDESQERDKKIAFSGYIFSPSNDFTSPITEGNRQASIKFTLGYDADEDSQIIVSIPGSLIRDSQEITVESDVVAKGKVTFKESPSDSKGQWDVELNKKMGGMLEGQVIVNFYLGKWPVGTNFTSEVVIANSENNEEYMRNLVYIDIPKQEGQSPVSKMSNTVATPIPLGEERWVEGRNYLLDAGLESDGFKDKIGEIYVQDTSYNYGGVSLSGPLLDEDALGSEAEGVIIEEILSEGLELERPTQLGTVPESEMLDHGIAIAVTKLSVDENGKYTEISNSLKWSTTELNFSETTNSSPKEREIYIGKNEEDKTVIRANLGTIPSDEKWIMRYFPKVTSVPDNSTSKYPAFINQCYVSTKNSRENQLEPLHHETWQTFAIEESPKYYSAKLKADKEEVKQSEGILYTLDLNYTYEVDSFFLIDIDLGEENEPQNIEVSSPNLTAKYEDGQIRVSGTILSTEEKVSIHYFIDTSRLPFGEKVLNSFVISSMTGMGSFYQGNNVETEILSEIDVVHIDDVDDSPIESETLYGKVGSGYETAALTDENYTLLEEPANAFGEYLSERQKVIYRYSRAFSIIEVQFIDQDGEEIMEGYTVNKNYGETYDIEEVNLTGYKLTSTENTSGVADQPNILATFKYQGLLYFKEVPTAISFGKNPISKHSEILFAKEYTRHLIVQDNRTLGNPWTITSRITKDFQGESERNLNKELYYMDGNVEHDLSHETEEIHKEISTDHEPIDLSDEWDGQHGLELKLNVGAALAEVYSGEITWTLRDAP
jgi:hypothetical protein